MDITINMDGTPYECAAAVQVQSGWEVFQSIVADEQQYSDIDYSHLLPFAQGLSFLLDTIGRCDDAWHGIGRESDRDLQMLPERLRHIANLLDAGIHTVDDDSVFSAEKIVRVMNRFTGQVSINDFE